MPILKEKFFKYDESALPFLPDIGDTKKQADKGVDVLKSNIGKEFLIFFDISQEPPENYKQAAFNTLLDDLKQVGVKSVKDVFVRFNFHYAPTLAFIRKRLDGVDIQLHRRYYLAAEDKTGGENLYLKIVTTDRRVTHPMHLPINLVQEVAWTKDNMDTLIKDHYDFPEKVVKKEARNSGAGNSKSVEEKAKIWKYKYIGGDAAGKKDDKAAKQKKREQMKRNPRVISW